MYVISPNTSNNHKHVSGAFVNLGAVFDSVPLPDHVPSFTQFVNTGKVETLLTERSRVRSPRRLIQFYSCVWAGTQSHVSLDEGDANSEPASPVKQELLILKERTPQTSNSHLPQTESRHLRLVMWRSWTSIRLPRFKRAAALPLRYGEGPTHIRSLLDKPAWPSETLPCSFPAPHISPSPVRRLKRNIKSQYDARLLISAPTVTHERWHDSWTRPNRDLCRTVLALIWLTPGIRVSEGAGICPINCLRGFIAHLIFISPSAHLVDRNTASGTVLFVGGAIV
ncbi:hypothetical protein J6590_034023 [Homalodisca vitripennis]|nr:hypothetical protein J6590_034023 [Homalodisca vitripennis]